jgi:hypothetical protein
LKRHDALSPSAPFNDALPGNITFLNILAVETVRENIRIDKRLKAAYEPRREKDAECLIPPTLERRLAHVQGDVFHLMNVQIIYAERRCLNLEIESPNASR